MNLPDRDMLLRLGSKVELATGNVDGLWIMSKGEPLQNILAEANRREKEYDWLSAVDLHKKASDNASKQEDYANAGEIQERTGLCFHRAAMQAKNQKEFKERMLQAIDSYKKAKEFYRKLSGDEQVPKMTRCDAVIKYINHWLSSDPSQKRTLLDECLKLEGKALSAFWNLKKAAEYGRTYKNLSHVFWHRIKLEWDRKVLKGIIARGILWGEQAMEVLSDVGDSHETAGAHFTLATCLAYAGSYLIAEPEEIEKNRLRVVKYLNNAINISEKIDDTYLLGFSHLWLGENTGGEDASRHYRKTLDCGRLTHDNLLISLGLDTLAYVTYWKAIATEDPETRNKLAKEAIQFHAEAQHHASIPSFMTSGAFISHLAGHAEHFWQLATWETDAKQRLELLEESEKAGMKALKLAVDSDIPLVVAIVHHVVSKTLESLARLKSNFIEKVSLLRRALEYRERTIEIYEEQTPFDYYGLGVMQNYLAGIKAELADVEPNLQNKKKLLEEAALSKRSCLELCNKMVPYYEKQGFIRIFASFQRFQDSYATLLTRLYELTGKLELLREAVEIQLKAIESAGKANMESLIAESYWKIAKAQDIIGEHVNAAKSFERASKSYMRSAKKIPQLKNFCQDYATYMQSWNEIEKAKYHHVKNQYGVARECYEKAASLHQSTERWHYLSPNYSAWARLEEAEELSRKEQIEEAKDLFEQAAELFTVAKRSIKTRLAKIEVRDEKKMAVDLVKASHLRHEYCLGRIALEEAKILDRQGDHAASSMKYGSATTRFQKVVDAMERESDRQDLRPIICLCCAWQTMTRAEAEASPDLYLEASQLFDKAKEHGFSEKARLLALGHSRFCKALEAGMRFEDTRDRKLYLTATQHLASAANHYVKAGFKIASEYVLATQHLFDAYVYMDNAKKEIDPGKKARYYVIAERVLQTSIGSYLKAKHPAKSKQVQRLLENVREERELAISLSKILKAPNITSSTESFATPTPSEERAVGLERLERANLQANLIIQTEEIRLGEDFTFEIQVVNVGKKTVLLSKVEEIIPSSFELVAKPSHCYLEDTYLNMRGKQLDPLKTEQIRLVLRSFEKGIFEMKPRIVFVDEDGHEMFCDPKPIPIEVSEVVLADRITTGYSDLDGLLFGGIPENYAVILTSPSCDEKDLLIKRFLEAGVRKGKVTFYTTIDPGEAKTLAEEFPNFYLFICSPQADKMVKSLPNVFKLKGVENLTDINISLTSAFRKLNKKPSGPRSACLEIVSDVLLQHHAVHTRRWLIGLLQEFKSKGFTTLAVMDPGMHPSQEVRAVLGLFDGEINIYEKEGRKGLHKFLKINKMTRQKYSKSELSLQEEKLQE